jgi:uroporphyrinogen-III decarboxylase
MFAKPEFVEVFQTLARAGEEEERHLGVVRSLDKELVDLGFPAGAHGMGAGGAPFDVVSDSLRGMRSSMLDLYRRPDKLLAACNKILTWQIARVRPIDPAAPGNPKIAVCALHRGSQGFLSTEQFEKFYWPGLKSAILATIDAGYVAEPFFEGKWDDRLEYLLEIPKGKMIARFSETDMHKAKAVLGGHHCIMGNVPASLLQTGSPQEVTDYCKALIDIFAKDGGFILRASTDSIDDARPANVSAMVETAKQYG